MVYRHAARDHKNDARLIRRSILALAALVLLSLYLQAAHAGGWHHTPHEPPEPPPEPPPARLVQAVDYNDLAEAMATGAACGGNFHYGTSRPQMRVDVATIDGHTKSCIQGGWHPDNTRLMFDAGYIHDDDPDRRLYRGGVLIVF